MTQEAAVPRDLQGQIRKMIQQEVAAAMRSAPNRNSSLSAGGRFTIKGGALSVEAADGGPSFFVGGIQPSLPDGTYQPGMILHREDGTVAMALYDPDPDPGGPDDYKQFLAVFDREGNILFADDTESGQGIARPGLSGGFAATRFANFGCSTTSATFVTVADQWVTKQQPRLDVLLRASMDTAGTTGEVRVLVDGVQFGSTTSESFVVNERFFGPAPVAGLHTQELHVEIQGRRTSATGTLFIEPVRWRGRQSS